MARYVGYSALMDFFPTMEIKANPGCLNGACCRRQKEWHETYNSSEAVAAREAAVRTPKHPYTYPPPKPLHRM